MTTRLRHMCKTCLRVLLTPVGKRVPVRKGKGAPHGVALLMVMLALALLSAVTADLGNNEMIRWRLAMNERDALKAEALAESSTNIARLLLTMQSAVQPCIARFADMGIPLPAHTFWQIVPLDSELLKGLTSGELQTSLGLDVSKSVEERKARLETARAEKRTAFEAEHPGEEREPFEPPEGGFGYFEGQFSADIQDEEQRAATLRGFAQTSTPQQCYAQATRLFNVLAPARYDFLFEDRDDAGNRTDRTELVANLYDWVDDNQEAIDPNADQNSYCRSQGGAEDGAYSSSYKVVPKNAYFDSPGELRMVRGMSDAALRAFGDKITIYGEGKVNILSAPIGTVEAVIRACAQQGDPLMLNEQWMQETLSGWEQWKTAGPLLGGGPATPDGLLAFLDTRGMVVDAEQCKAQMTTESKNFTVRATATVLDVTRTMTTVMRVYNSTEELYYYSIR